MVTVVHLKYKFVKFHYKLHSRIFQGYIKSISKYENLVAYYACKNQLEKTMYVEFN